MSERELSRELAHQVFASLADVPAVALRLLSQALRFADEPITRFALPLDYYADVL